MSHKTSTCPQVGEMDQTSGHLENLIGKFDWTSICMKLNQVRQLPAHAQLPPPLQQAGADRLLQ